MGFVIRGLRGPTGQEWARTLWFGEDTSAPPEYGSFCQELSKPVRELVDLLWAAAETIESEASAAGAYRQLLDGLSAALRGRASAVAKVLADSDADEAARPFRVVLMGRTMAGKSTLFEFLTDADRSRVGHGQQRMTRTACLRGSDLLGFDIVDTPGVGALDGQEDYAAAFTEVPGADLVVWVASNDATQEETGRALAELAMMGKPVVVALNCRANLDDLIAREDFLADPEQIFGGDTLGNLGPIDRHLASGGGQRLGVVLVHADAALRSSAAHNDPELGRLLRANSRIDDLVHRLRAERSRTADARRILSICDRLRLPLLDTAESVRSLLSETRAVADRGRGASKAFQSRADLRIADARAELLTAVAEIVGRRERWWEEIEIEIGISQLWAREERRISDELHEVFQSISDRLVVDLEAINTEIADDWSTFDSASFEDLTGYGQVWAGRASKFASKFAFTALGAAIGTFVTPGPGTGVGAAIGAVIDGVVALIRPARKFVDRMFTWFKTRDQIDRENRETVRKQLRLILEAICSTMREGVERVVGDWQRAVSDQVDLQSSELGRVSTVGDRLDDVARAVRGTVGSVDVATARHLLASGGRTRAADAVLRASRWQGVGIVVELPEPAFTEQVLFPIDFGEEIICLPLTQQWASSRALAILQGLISGDATVNVLGATTLQVTVHACVPGGIREAWAALAQIHTGLTPAIEQGEKP